MMNVVRFQIETVTFTHQQTVQKAYRMLFFLRNLPQSIFEHSVYPTYQT